MSTLGVESLAFLRPAQQKTAVRIFVSPFTFCRADRTSSRVSDTDNYGRRAGRS